MDVSKFKLPTSTPGTCPCCSQPLQDGMTLKSWYYAEDPKDDPITIGLELHCPACSAVCVSLLLNVPRDEGFRITDILKDVPCEMLYWPSVLARE